MEQFAATNNSTFVIFMTYMFEKKWKFDGVEKIVFIRNCVFCQFTNWCTRSQIWGLHFDNFFYFKQAVSLFGGKGGETSIIKNWSTFKLKWALLIIKIQAFWHYGNDISQN